PAPRSAAGVAARPAWVMLESTRAPLKTVAYQCGFRDAQHMRSVFNRRLGVTPQQYRQNFAAMV
ncbi:MAG: helix-turn-helix domain-containing protein, partial [Pseudomonas umsongensis]|nr:helix-turn-helix domain-containing protein [Pseudomonas umsongensis]